MSKYFILQTPTHPLNISKVSPCHYTFSHPPMNIYDVKKFHFRNPSNRSKVSSCHCTCTRSPMNSYIPLRNSVVDPLPPLHHPAPHSHHPYLHNPPLCPSPPPPTMSKYFILQTPTCGHVRYDGWAWWAW